MTIKKYSVVLTFALALCLWGKVIADETELPLPPAPSEEKTPPADDAAAQDAQTAAPAARENLEKLQVVAISGKVPYYVDNGTAMVPIRPICEFLGLETTYRSGIVSITGILQSSSKTLAADESDDSDEEKAGKAPQGNPIFVNFRVGNKVAQIIEGVHNRTFNLDAVPEMRLGVTFVPLRFVASAFDSKVTYNAKNALITVQKGNRIGYLRQPDQCSANVKKTVKLTVANRVGRAFTLQLKGPCSFRIELGRLQKVTVKLPAGLYEYTAVSRGVYPKRGKRWLRSGAQVNWTFGG